MLGIFKGRNREKTRNNEIPLTNKEEQKPKRNIENETREKGKDEKISRFSFKRRKSSEKRKNKTEGADLSGSSNSSTVSVSSAPSDCNEKAIQNDAGRPKQSEEGGADNDEGKVEFPSEESQALSESDARSEITSISDTSLSSSVADRCNQASLLSGELDESFSISDSSNCSSLKSKKSSHNAMFFPPNITVNELPKIRSLNSLSPSGSSRYPSTTLFHSQCNIGNSNESIKTLIHSPSHEGSLSMLSTPSSSTSSLSSISSRPISPSGRRTPPGPKLGTAVRIPSSPTPIRKTSRTHIKTNPTISSSTRRAGSISPSHTLTVNIPTNESCSAFLSKTGRPPEHINGFSTKSPSCKRSTESKPVIVLTDPSTVTPPQSPSSNSARLRHSVSSMKSLESIPENEYDATGERKDNQRNSPNRSSPKLGGVKLANKPQGTSPGKENIKEACNKDTLKHQTTTSPILQPKASNSGKIPCTDIQVNQEGVIVKKSALEGKKLPVCKSPPLGPPRSQLRPNHRIVTAKPPSISKKPKEQEKIILSSSDCNNIPESTIANLLPTASPQSVSDAENRLITSNSNIDNFQSNPEQLSQLHSDDVYNKSNDQVEGATHFVFTIPIRNTSKKTSSLENLCGKSSFKEDIFPRSSSPLRHYIRGRRSKSLSRVDFTPLGTCIKLEIPNLTEELRRQVNNIANEKLHQLGKKEAKTKEECGIPTLNISKLDKHCLTDASETTADISQDQTEKVSIELPPPIGKSPTSKNVSAINLSNSSDRKDSTKCNGTTEGNQPPIVAETPNEISESHSTTPDPSNESQNFVREIITIQIEDSPNFLSNKIEDMDSSFENLKKELKDKLIQTEGLNEEEKLRSQLESSKKELAAQEDRYKKQVDDLTRKLGEKQQEVKDLSLELKETRQATLQKDFSAQRYETQIEELKTQIKEQETKTEGVRVELRLSKNEIELSKAKMRHLEEELSKANELTNSLREQNTSRSRESARYKELEDKVKSLEDRLKKSEFTRRDLETSLTEIETERDEELKIVQGALDEAAEEREELISSFKRELELLNTTNTAREQQMLDDFEWKLHEMEKEYKTKLEENNRLAEERLRTMRSTVESELSETLSTVTEERKIADEKLMKVGHLMSYEAEVIQLRGVTHEFQKSLRSTARELESMKVRERLLNEEIRSLKTGAQSRQNTLQRVKRHADEEEVRQKLEKLRNEINAEWEDKLRQECSRLKSELDKLHSEEKHLAVESMKVQKEQETQRLKKSWEQRREEMANQITSLKDTLSDKEAYYRRELDNRRTTADRDVWDLRMKLQKLNESSFDQKQLLEEKYTEDTERLKVDYEDRIKELESRLAICDAQKGIDMIGQLEKEHKLQMQHVGEQHQLSMERLQEELEGEKFQAVEDARVIITNHHLEIESNLREQLTEMQKNESQIRDELEAVRFSLQRREEALRTLEDELDRYKDLKGDSYSSTTSSFPPATSTTSSGFSSSQFSLASSNDSHGSRNSQDRYSIHDSASLADCQDESQRNSGLLGKVFGGGWFTPSKSYNRRGSTPLSSKKPYS